MLRQPRLDTPGVLHHMMVRGLDRRPILRDDSDHGDFLARVATRGTAGTWTVYA